jgi:hypothetical protein
MHRTRILPTLILLAAIPSAHAQTPPADEGSPVVVDPVPAAGNPALPGNIVRQDLAPTSSGLVREGAFISEHQGLLRPLKGGGWAFVFDPDDEDDRLKPMIIQPGLRLTEMRRLVEASDRPITFRISGRVLVFNNRNYILTTFYTTVAVGERESIAPGVDDRTDDPALEEFEDLFLDTDGDPTLDEAIEAVERLDRPTDVSVPRGTGEPSEQTEQSDEPARLIREGVQITARTGRLVRSPDGGWLMTFDNDTDQPATTSDGATLDTPMQILPCLSLQSMQALAEQYGSRLRFTVSGTVYVYESRNYLLPTMYIIEIDRTGNLTPGQ